MSAALRKYCEQVVSVCQSGTSIYAMLLAHGQEFAPAACPEQYQGMPKKYCFCNSIEIMEMTGSLTYCEGLAISGTLGIPVHHGWCIDAKGNVVDPTWDNPEISQYFGIPIKREFVLDIYHSTSCASVFENWDDSRIYTALPEDFLSPVERGLVA